MHPIIAFFFVLRRAREEEGREQAACQGEEDVTSGLLEGLTARKNLLKK